MGNKHSSGKCQCPKNVKKNKHHHHHHHNHHQDEKHGVGGGGGGGVGGGIVGQCGVGGGKQSLGNQQERQTKHHTSAHTNVVHCQTGYVDQPQVTRGLFIAREDSADADLEVKLKTYPIFRLLNAQG
ncbi:hypothetical protein E2C01_059169 [Portunus trituberculatus]|uniref:Uncharacterized protein n=1 Tax=Portunus trituberculatus TaxID=210409 RepID=A0A5B7H636_PORTR|nr:hypothetical protein [Portunus trituberculatus]